MITRMVNRLRMIRWTRTTSAESRRRRRQSLWFETLELRATPSADLTALLVDSLADYAIPGQSLAISTTVKNVGADSSQDFNVEYRLSSDQVISNTDLLLGTSLWQSLEAGEEKDLPFSVTIPAGTAHGSYYVGVIVLPNGTVGDIGVAGIGWYNCARFGSITESGLHYQLLTDGYLRNF